MSIRFAARIALALSAVVVAIAVFYTPEGRWTPGTMGGPPIAAAPFAVALSACVKAHDPDGFAVLKRTGDYRMSGWFVPPGRRGVVDRCMAKSGWLYAPLHLYSP